MPQTPHQRVNPAAHPHPPLCLSRCTSSPHAPPPELSRPSMLPNRASMAEGTIPQKRSSPGRRRPRASDAPPCSSVCAAWEWMLLVYEAVPFQAKGSCAL
eukprot:1160748-Pelagomonas_calceolata.AAC.2